MRFTKSVVLALLTSWLVGSGHRAQPRFVVVGSFREDSGLVDCGDAAWKQATDGMSASILENIVAQFSGVYATTSVGSIVCEMKEPLVTIPGVVPARHAGDVALVADAIARRNEDRTEDGNCAGYDG